MKNAVKTLTLAAALTSCATADGGKNEMANLVYRDLRTGIEYANVDHGESFVIKQDINRITFIPNLLNMSSKDHIVVQSFDLNDCSISGFICLYGGGFIFVVPAGQVRLGDTFSVLDMSFTVESCEIDDCSQYTVSYVESGGESVPVRRGDHVKLLPAGRYDVDAEKGIVSFWVLSNENLEEREYTLIGDRGILSAH